jgi:hypothetical protein
VGQKTGQKINQSHMGLQQQHQLLQLLPPDGAMQPVLQDMVRGSCTCTLVMLLQTTKGSA